MPIANLSQKKKQTTTDTPTESVVTPQSSGIANLAQPTPVSSVSGAVSSLPEFTPVQPIAPVAPKKQNWLDSILTKGANAVDLGAKALFAPGLVINDILNPEKKRNIIQPIVTGAANTVGSSVAAMEEFNKKAILNPVGHFVDKLAGRTPTDTYGPEDTNAGDDFTSWVNKADTHLRELNGTPKDFIDQVLEGVGSSVPFLLGGEAAALGAVGKSAKAVEMANLMVNLGMSGTEAMINTYDDYKTLKENGDKNIAGKTLGSFVANLGVNYISNKLGFLEHVNPKATKGAIAAAKSFLASMGTEIGQEVSQGIVSDVVRGTPFDQAVRNAVQTAAVTAPVAALFGGVGAHSTINQVQANNETRDFLKDAASKGATKQATIDVYSALTGADKAEVTARFDDFIKDDTELQKTFDKNIGAEVEEIAKPFEVTKEVTPVIENKTTTSEEETPAYRKSETELTPIEQEARKYKSAEDFVKSKGDPVYHGSKSDIKEFSNDYSKSGWLGKGIYITKNKNYAKTYGKVLEAYPEVKNVYKAKSNDWMSLLSELNKKYPEIKVDMSTDVAEKLKSRGYDALEMTSWDSDIGTMVNIFDAKNIKTKSQLTDIYNKATQKVDNITKQSENKDNATNNTTGEERALRESGQGEGNETKRSGGSVERSFRRDSMEAAERLSQYYREDGKRVELVVRQAKQLGEGESVRINEDTGNILRESGFSEELVRALEDSQKNGAVRNVVVSETHEGQSFISAYKTDTLYLNPNEKDHSTYQDGSIINHELAGHSWYRKLSQENRQSFYTNLKSNKATVRAAWEDSDNPHNNYWQRTLEQVEEKIHEKTGNADVTARIVTEFGLTPGDVSLDIFIERSLNIDKTIAAINAELARIGIDPLALEARNTVAIEEHVAMIAENASKVPSETDEMQNYISDVQTNSLKYGSNANKALTYTGETDLTIKTLEKLKGRDTVSKQFISDMTNSGDIKQVERDIIRDVLAQYPEGAKIPVAEFAEKVKVELLPLKRNTLPSNQGVYENISLPRDIKGRVANYRENLYESPIKTSAGDTHWRAQQNKNYFGHTRIEDMADNYTRRVIEVQSDLYQKGNLEREVALPNRIKRPQIEKEIADLEERIASEGGRFSRESDIKSLNEWKKTLAELNAGRGAEIAKLQQYNDPTAHFRMVREEVKKAAEDGKTKLLFPTGETAMKIEGLGEGNHFRIERDGLTPALKPEEVKVGEEVLDGSFDRWIITEVLGDGKFKAVPKELATSTGTVEEFIADLPNKPAYVTNHIETFDISGKVDTNNPIYKFYEKEMGRYLKNQYGATPVIDKNGVSWYQVDVTPEMATAPVVAFREKDNRSPQQILMDAENKAFGRVMPEEGPKDMVQVQEVARTADNFDDFNAILRAGEDAVMPFYEENKEIPILNPNYEGLVKQMNKEGYTSLEDFYFKNKNIDTGKVTRRIKQIRDTINTVTNKGKFTEAEVKEILTPEKIEAERVRYAPIKKVTLPDNLQQMEYEISNLSYLINETEQNLKYHPGQKLQKFMSTKEGEFLDFKNPNSAKTPAERQAIIERNQKVFAASKAAFDGTALADQFDDQDVIRDQIAEYKSQKERLANLIEERKNIKRDFYAKRNLFYGEERNRLAMNTLVAKEERFKMQREVEKILRAEGRARKQMIEDIRDYFYLTEKEMNQIIGGEDYRLMSDKEFNAFTEKIKEKFFEVRQHADAVAEVERTIAEKELKLTENLQKAMNLAEDRTKISTEDLVRLNDLLGMFEQGDVFLGAREIETLAKNTDLPHVKTRRQIIEEVITKRTGISPQKALNITTSFMDKFNSASILSEQNVFFKVMVEDAYRMKIQAELNYEAINEKTQELAKKARASRKRRLIDRLIPTDKLVVQYLEEPEGETKTRIAQSMTSAELEFAHYVQDQYIQMRDYLVKKNMLDKFRENYYTHTQRGFLESLFNQKDVSASVQSMNGEKTGKNFKILRAFGAALKETVFDVYKLEEATFTILNEKTGEILPLEKFFKYSMKRTGKLIPTENVAKAFLGYVKTFEVKRALDSYIPKIEATARALSPMETTEKGLALDDSLERFVKKWINTQKGRPASLGIIDPGDTIDRLIRSTLSYIRFVDLAFRPASQMAAPVGEHGATYIAIGGKRYATGIARATTKQGKEILRKYEGFIGDSLLNRLSDESRDVGSKAGELAFAFYGIASRSANAVHLLGSLTPEEFKSGEVSTKHLAEIKLEMGRWRNDETLKSIIGATSVGGVFRQHKSWAIPIFTQTVSNLRTVADAIKKDGVNGLKNRETGELFRAAIFTSIIALTLLSYYDSLKNKKDRNFIEELQYKLINDAFSFVAALSPTTLFSAPRLVTWIGDLATGLEQLVTAIAAGESMKAGSKVLSNSLIPKVIRSAIPKDTKETDNAKRQIQKVYDKVQKLKEEGSTDEAKAYLDKMFPNTPEGDAGYAIYKTIAAAEKKAKAEKEITAKFNDLTRKERNEYVDLAKEIQRLKEDNNTTEAKALLDERFPNTTEGNAGYELYKYAKTLIPKDKKPTWKQPE